MGYEGEIISELSDKNICDYINCYLDAVQLYTYASKYWDGKVNAISLSSAIRRALQDIDCPNHIDHFESLVDNDLYAKPELCIEYEIKRFGKSLSNS